MPETTEAVETKAAPTFTHAERDAAASAAAVKAIESYDAARRGAGSGGLLLSGARNAC